MKVYKYYNTSLPLPALQRLDQGRRSGYENGGGQIVV